MKRSGSSAQATKRRPRKSYGGGRWGVNRVTIEDRGAKGLYLRWTEPEPTPTSPRERRRIALGHRDPERAEEAADAKALELRRKEEARPTVLVLSELFDNYLVEKTPGKGREKKKHDLRTAEMFVRHFGANRQPRTLDKRDFDGFVRDRRAGKIAPFQARKLEENGKKRPRPVGATVVGNDLRFLNAVFNWATTVRDGKGGWLLEKNPFKGFGIPKEPSPQRPMLTAQEFAVLRKKAREVHPMFELMLVIMFETGHRGASVRSLKWSDVDFTEKLIRWDPESDKIGFRHETAIGKELMNLLQRRQRAQSAVGGVYVFPALRDHEKPCSRSTFAKWWRAAEAKAEWTHVPRMGGHALRRLFATELKQAPRVDVAYAGGWKSVRTLEELYQKPDLATQRRMLEERREMLASSAGAKAQ
jgi:integrase